MDERGRPTVEKAPIRSDPGQVRLSDADREQAASRLQQALAEGRLSTEELDQRLARAFAAQLPQDLVPLLRDLPEPAAPAAHPDGTPLVGGEPGPRRSSVALLGTIRRAARWVVPARYTAAATLGTVELDLRDAVFAAPETLLRAYGLLGTVRVIVPPGVTVRAAGRSVLGPFGRGLDTGAATAAATGVTVRIEGVAFAGAVQVEVREPEPPKAPQAPRRNWWFVRIQKR
ncbi:DUF1707 domain-containing protein [Streptacidiphilus sp. N1-12]|uniref:DUF1707 domain-containing protein n=2 Tax=Streptacidiphilus alkalitolerans TaxID=3342712 RepID=A0ABV6WRU8_9ACTN